MTDVHAAIISPLTWILKMKHILWYAHANNSPFLVWSSFFVSGIVSSTEGSCNLKHNRNKIKLINQGIDEEDFPMIKRSSDEVKHLLYYGRVEPSKNIHLFLKILIGTSTKGQPVTIDVFGGTLNPESLHYLEYLKSTRNEKKLDSHLLFHGALKRIDIPKIASRYDAFLNLFSGSLDKTLIEATMLGMPVITWNQEYLKTFGTWSNQPVEVTLEFILMEIQCVQNLDQTLLSTELNRRHTLAVKEHSMSGWISRLVASLTESGS